MNLYEFNGIDYFNHAFKSCFHPVFQRSCPRGTPAALGTWLVKPMGNKYMSNGNMYHDHHERQLTNMNHCWQLLYNLLASMSPYCRLSTTVDYWQDEGSLDRFGSALYSEHDNCCCDNSLSSKQHSNGLWCSMLDVYWIINLVNHAYLVQYWLITILVSIASSLFLMIDKLLARHGWHWLPYPTISGGNLREGLVRVAMRI